MRSGPWTTRVSVGRGFFAATPLTEETEAAGLTRLTLAAPLRAERGTSASLDVTRTAGPATLTGTLFASRIAEPVRIDREDYVLGNLDEATTNVGAEVLATVRHAPFAMTGTYTYVRSRETAREGRLDVPLTPRHSAGVVAMAESEEAGRIGIEVYVTGQQRLEVNPYRDESEPYVIVGVLAERRFGKLRIFVNAENLTGVRQTLRRADALGSATAAHACGGWPLDGGRLGTTRRAHDQRRGSGGVLSPTSSVQAVSRVTITEDGHDDHDEHDVPQVSERRGRRIVAAVVLTRAGGARDEVRLKPDATRSG